MFDTMLPANALEAVQPVSRCRPRSMLRHIAELDTIIGQNGVDLVGDCSDQGFEEGCGGPDVGGLIQLGEGELRGPVDRHEQVQFALLGADLGDIDVEVADRVSLERLFGWLVTTDLGQSTDSMALRAAVQGAGSSPAARRGSRPRAAGCACER